MRGRYCCPHFIDEDIEVQREGSDPGVMTLRTVLYHRLPVTIVVFLKVQGTEGERG